MRNLTLLLACAMLSVLTACQPPEQPKISDGREFDWARQALERNPQLEIVAADSDAQVFTVRDRRSGEVLVLEIDDIVGAPIAQLKAAASQTAAAMPAAPEAAAAPPPETAPPPSAAPEAPEARSTPAMAQQTEPSSPSTDTPGYTIERTGGQIRVSGPGVSIVSAGTGRAESDVSPANARAVDPVICEGRRMLQLDSRDIYVEGDAIVARGGCELYITNSRVVGSNVGVVIQDATVHIANSHVEGQAASFNAGDGARLFIRNSTFQGLSRRSETAAVQDQGGNRWR
jgi:hypothetical protein